MITNKTLENWKATIISNGIPAFEKKVSEWLGKDKDAKQAQRLFFHWKQNGKCEYCGEVVGWKNMHIEHKTPKTKGGKETLENKCGVCGHCNSSKGNKTYEEYMHEIGNSSEEENTAGMQSSDEKGFRKGGCAWACFEVLKAVGDARTVSFIEEEIRKRGLGDFKGNGHANSAMSRYPHVFERICVKGKLYFKIKAENSTQSQTKNDTMSEAVEGQSQTNNKKQNIDRTMTNKLKLHRALVEKIERLERQIRIAEFEGETFPGQIDKLAKEHTDALILKHKNLHGRLPAQEDSKRKFVSRSDSFSSKLALFAVLLKNKQSEMTTLDSMKYKEMQEYVKANSHRFHFVKADKGEKEAWKDIAHSMENEIVHETCGRPIAKKFNWRRNVEGSFCAYVFSLKGESR